jgi:hypothetical protein
MLKDFRDLLSPDPYYAGTVGFIGSSLESLHDDMDALELPDHVPNEVARCHDAIRNAYIYSYFSYDLLTLAASQTFPCLELALRLRVGHQFAGRVYTKNGRPNPPKLSELLEAAYKQGLITGAFGLIAPLRNMFAHGSGTVLNPPMFLEPFKLVTEIIAELFDPAKDSRSKNPDAAA